MLGNLVKYKKIFKKVIAERSACPDCMACDPCPCPHMTLASLVPNKEDVVYIWNDAGTFTTGTKDEFETACTAAKGGGAKKK